MSSKTSSPTGGRRSAGAPVLLKLGLAAAPVETLRAIGDLLRGKRVRGWSGLNSAASRHPAYYRSWVRHGEPRAITAWLEGAGKGEAALPPVGLVGSPELAGPGFVSLAPSPARSVLDAARAHGCEWLLPVPPGWRLSPHLPAILARVPTSGPQVVYWDHDRLEGARRCHPVLKPAWDPLLQESFDLLTGAAMVRVDAAAAMAERTGAQDLHDLLVAVALQGDAAVMHLPLILSHYQGKGASAQPRPRPVPQGNPPGVSVIIPTRDRVDLLGQCLAGLSRLTYDGPVEIIILDNDSREAASKAFLARLAESGQCRVEPFPGPFNFAAMMNRGAALASQPMLCLLNNDMEMQGDDWLAHLVAHAVLPQTGAVGAQLLYPDGTIQHAGVAIGIGGAAGHVAKGADPRSPEWLPWHSVTRRVSAVTAACLVVEKSRFLAVGGMDADRFGVDFNDVDLCLRLQRAGYENRLVAEASLIHHESKSRGTERVGADRTRFEAELHHLQTSWHTLTAQDPWHHPLFRRDSQECLLQF